MAIEALLGAVRERPQDLDNRRVLADALLAAADPRGELMAAELAGLAVPAQAWGRCIDRARAALPETLEMFRIELGLVTELRIDDGDELADIDPDWLAGEPLVFAWLPLPSDDKLAIEPVLARAEGSLRRCRGFGCDGRIGGDRWPAFHGFVADLQPRRLALSLGVRTDELGIAAQPWPSVEVARLEANDPAALTMLIAEGLPGLRRLQLTGGDIEAGVVAALGLGTLEHLDLRGCSLSPALHARLRTWLKEDPARSLRHERFSLAPPDFDDAFGQRGLRWEVESALRCRAVALPAAGRVVCARGRELQCHGRDNPTWRRSAETAVTALGLRRGEGETVLLGREDGVVEAWNADGEPQGTVVALPGPIRSLRTFGDDLAVVHEGGWWSSRGHAGGEALVDLWLTAEGSVHAEGCRVVFRDGETERSVDLGEPVLALAVEDAGTPDEWPMVVVAAGRQIWRLDLEGPTCLGSRRGGRAMITIGQERAAWSTSRTTAALLDMRGEQNGPSYLTYANRYSDNGEDELALADLCVVDHELVAAALENGGMNLLGPEGAMKADEFPGEPVRRWIFFYLGSILMAG